MIDKIKKYQQNYYKKNRENILILTRLRYKINKKLNIKKEESVYSESSFESESSFDSNDSDYFKIKFS